LVSRNLIQHRIRKLLQHSLVYASSITGSTSYYAGGGGGGGGGGSTGVRERSEKK
jgi:hypothetical protein